MRDFETYFDKELEEHEAHEAKEEVLNERSSFVCDDCDYRWEDTYTEEDMYENALVCIMCGSLSVTQL